MHSDFLAEGSNIGILAKISLWSVRNFCGNGAAFTKIVPLITLKSSGDVHNSFIVDKVIVLLDSSQCCVGILQPLIELCLHGGRKFGLGFVKILHR